MLIVHCTRKMLRWLGVAATDIAATPEPQLGSWHAALLHEAHAPTIVIMGDLTELVVALPAGDAATAPERIAAAIVAGFARIPGPRPDEPRAPIIFAALRAEDQEFEESWPTLAIASAVNARRSFPPLEMKAFKEDPGEDPLDVLGALVPESGVWLYLGPPPSLGVFEVSVRLRVDGPAIWRVVRLESGTTLRALREFLAAELGWGDQPWRGFAAAGDRCGTIGGGSTDDELTHTVGQQVTPFFTGVTCEQGEPPVTWYITLWRTVDSEPAGELPRVVAGQGDPRALTPEQAAEVDRRRLRPLLMRCPTTGTWIDTGRMGREGEHELFFAQQIAECTACWRVHPLRNATTRLG